MIRCSEGSRRKGKKLSSGSLINPEHLEEIRKTYEVMAENREKDLHEREIKREREGDGYGVLAYGRETKEDFVVRKISEELEHRRDELILLYEWRENASKEDVEKIIDIVVKGEETLKNYNLKTRGNQTSYTIEMPFIKSWQALGFKRMLRLAVINGFDKITWESAEESIRRGATGAKGKRLEYDVLLPQVAKKMIKEYGGEYGRIGVSQDIPNNYLQDVQSVMKEKIQKVEGSMSSNPKKMAMEEIFDDYKNNVDVNYGMETEHTATRMMTFGAEKSHFMTITPEMKAFVMGGMRMFKAQGSFYESTATLEEKWNRNMSRSKTFKILDDVLNLYKDRNPNDEVGVIVAKTLFCQYRT